jgi:ribosomal protein S27E
VEITEKVAYLKGLVEGFGFDKSTKEGKVILTILDILDDLALAVSDLEDGMEQLSEQVDEMDEDFSDLADDFYDDDEDDDEDFDGELYEVTCPSCHHTVCVDEDMLDEGEIVCPNCGETLEFDLEGILDGCDCGCEDDDEDDD